MSPLPPLPYWAAFRAGRCLPGMRRVGAWAAACCALVACVLPAPAVAQANGGQIYIPGPGGRSASSASNGTPGTDAGGMITIPGNGEHGASASSNAPGTAGTGIITIPGPGERVPPRTPAPASAALQLQRETLQAAQQRVTPVVVTPEPRPTRPAQPVVVDRPAGVGSAALNIDPLANRGEPPRLDARGALQRAASDQPTWGAAPAAHPPSPSSAPVQSTALTASAPDAAPAGQQDGESIRRAALAFLQQQTVGLPGKVTATVAPAFARGLAACTTLAPFMPPGAPLWGRTTVGVRCAGARPWTLYLQARVSLEAPYYLAARQIEPGTVLTVADLTTREGDLANLPRAIITDASQAVGAVALERISAGMPLRQDMLKSATSVTIGQTVRVVAVGQGFTISSEGSVMNNATPGQQVRVKTPGGQIISGIVKDGSTVQIPM
jgi:flagella basal body P-ring formation protein FlgA